MCTASQFHYDLAESFIAQQPVSPRDAAKLMLINRMSQSINHRIFYELSDILTANDVLVVNDSKVFPARLVGLKESGGHAEVLLLRPTGTDTWEAMSNGLKPSQIVRFSKGLIGTVVSKDTESGNIIISLTSEVHQTTNLGGSIFELIEKVGQTPLPHYIHTPLSENLIRSEYQTVYADQLGSAAAPTAGMHFTNELLSQLREKGVQIEQVTLHVGPGTFAKLRPEQIEAKSLHTEWYEIKPEVADRLHQAKAAGKRIIAIGTTACRTLESWANLSSPLQSGFQSTSIFIMPGYQFKFVDALITNFHLPESSLLMLVSAFCSQPNTSRPFTTFRENLMGKAYEAAKANCYRFFSFGDAMLIE